MPPGFMELVFEVHFHHGDLVPAPLNQGPLPLLVLDTSGVHNFEGAAVSVLQPGGAPVGFDFPEQKIALSGTAEQISSLAGDFALEFNGAVTGMMPIYASAATVTAALKALETVGEAEVCTKCCFMCMCTVHVHVHAHMCVLNTSPALLHGHVHVMCRSSRARAPPRASG